MTDLQSETILRTPEAAAYLKLAQPTLEKYRVRGEGPPFVKIGPRVVGYRRTDLDAWLANRVCMSTSGAQKQEAAPKKQDEAKRIRQRR
jgi:predicted DNA-binding transcriptional regulator AlpA